MQTLTVLSSLSSVIKSINRYSTRGCHCLGKFTNGRKPRPTLVKMIHTVDVCNLQPLSSKLADPVRLRRDLSCGERKVEALLLSERWSLINSSIER